MASDQSDLAAPAFSPLPLGSISPRGWLHRQLEIQASSLTGHLDEIWDDLADNRWRGGQHDGWERGPYYADGLVPLAYLLEDPALIAKAETWIAAFLDNREEDGWIGPAVPDGDYEQYDPWPRFVVLKALTQYHEATGDEQALAAIRDFLRYLSDALDERPLFSWGKFRWADLLISIYWLYERSPAAWLLDLAETVIEQGYDWATHFRTFPYPEKQPIDETPLETHVVNNAMGLKSPALTYRQTGAETAEETAVQAITILDRFHGQVTGVFTGDEHLAGRNPTQGTELCAVVEYLFSLEQLLATFGTSTFGDRLERIAFNALPATFTADMWTHQYDQQVNQVLCTIAQRDWTNGPDANIFGLEPNFGCCTANMHQGWPKFAASLWMRRADGGFATTAYAPCELTTTLETGEEVRIIEETAYPFEDTVRFRIECDDASTFPLALRIPAWANEPVIETPAEQHRPPTGAYYVLTRTWEDGDEVELTIPAPIETDRRYHGAVAIHRGPLVFSLPIDAETRLIGDDTPYADREFHPLSSWNYGLKLDIDQPDRSVTLDQRPPGAVPFSPTEPPVSLTVRGTQLPAWQLDQNNAGPIPQSPSASAQDTTDLHLVPYGCTILRVTEFPLLEAEPRH